MLLNNFIYNFWIYQSLILLSFLFINIYILFIDFKIRKISNNSLIALLCLLPFWYSIFPPVSRSSTLLLVWTSIFVLTLGVIFHNSNRWLWSWDIKYFALLVLFLTQTSISTWIINISILTLFVLFSWIIFLLWSFTWFLSKYGQDIPYFKSLSSFFRDIHALFYLYDEKKEKTNIVLSFFFDWIFLGFVIYIIFPPLISTIFLNTEFISPNPEIYFLLSICIFIIRPYIHKFIFSKANRILWSIITWCILILLVVDTNFLLIVEKLVQYILGIWKYTVILVSLSVITAGIFRIYKNLLWLHYREYTFPYSIVIFLWVLSAMIFEKNLIEQVLHFF